MPPPRRHRRRKQLPETQKTPPLIDLPGRAHPQPFATDIRLDTVTERAPAPSPRSGVDRMGGDSRESSGGHLRSPNVGEWRLAQRTPDLDGERLEKGASNRPANRKGCSRLVRLVGVHKLLQALATTRVRWSNAFVSVSIARFAAESRVREPRSLIPYRRQRFHRPCRQPLPEPLIVQRPIDGNGA